MKSNLGFIAADLAKIQPMAFVWKDMEKKLTWISTESKLVLAARMTTLHYNWEISASEFDLDPVQVWCEKNNCGKRISFDQFRFRNKKEVTMFLLRWS